MEKSNQKRLEEYLVGENGYLKSDISNGKVIMLSGKWGSGKTYFWKNIIEKELIEHQTKKQKAYVYSSLYGNRTLDKIEDNIYAQAYLCSVGGKNAVLSGYEKVKDFGKRFGSFCSLLDVSKLVDGIDDIQQKNIKKSALSYLENGGIVCFDDFERKSKDIDLNDLFGFISHLAIDLNCKVVIILNDDVFEGEEKKIFSNVKEKSVSKFLKYKPSIKELFETIYEKHNLYNTNKELGETILNFIKESDILNARIYIQVLDNLVEWIEKKQEIDADILRCLILVNINFILYHTIFYRDGKLNDSSIFNLHKILKLSNEDYDYMKNNYVGLSSFREPKTFEEYVVKIQDRYINKKDIKDETVRMKIQFIENNIILFKSDYFVNKLDISKNVDDRTFQKINNFIETGILIDE
jgi:hypothetical protein